MVQSFLIFVSTQIFHPILKRLDIGTVPCVAPVVTEFFAWSDSSGDKCMIILFKNFFHGLIILRPTRIFPLLSPCVGSARAAIPSLLEV